MAIFAKRLVSLSVLCTVCLTACATQDRLVRDNGPVDVQTLMILGNKAFKNHQWSLARRYYLRVYKLEPENTNAVYKVAAIDFLQDEDLSQARYILQQAIPAANPIDAPRLLDILARIDLREGRFDDAKAALDEAEAPVHRGEPDLSDLLKETDDNIAQAPKR